MHRQITWGDKWEQEQPSVAIRQTLESQTKANLLDYSLINLNPTI